jgi:hypothetical protein
MFVGDFLTPVVPISPLGLFSEFFTLPVVWAAFFYFPQSSGRRKSTTATSSTRRMW